MNHADLKKYLADYLEGDLPLERRAQVDAHLDDCAECAQHVAEFQETIQLLRLMPDPEPPPMISANVMRRIRAGETEPGFLTRVARGFSSILEPSFVLPASAIAAAALVVVVVQEPGALQRFTTFALPETDQSAGNPPAGWLRGPTETAGVGTSLVAVADPSGAAQRAPLRQGSTGMTAAPRIQISIAASPFPQQTSFSSSQTLYSSQAPYPSQTLHPSQAPYPSQTLHPSQTPYPSQTLHPSQTLNSSQTLYPTVPGWVASNGGLASVSQDLGMDHRTRAVVESWGIGSGEDPRLHHATQPHRGSARASTSASSDDSAGTGISGGFTSAGGFTGSNGFTSSGGEDPRDIWLVRGLADPAGFAHFLASKNLAEQELWVSRLASRALARGLLDDLVTALRASGDVPAAILSDDFAAQAAPSGDVAPTWNAPYER